MNTFISITNSIIEKNNRMAAHISDAFASMKEELNWSVQNLICSTAIGCGRLFPA